MEPPLTRAELTTKMKRATVRVMALRAMMVRTNPVMQMKTHLEEGSNIILIVTLFFS